MSFSTQGEGDFAPGPNRTQFAEALSSQISRMDAIIDEHTTTIEAIQNQVVNLVHNSHGARCHNIPTPSLLLTSHDTPITTEELATPSAREQTNRPPNDILPMHIPVGHGTTTEDLLRTEQAKGLLCDYPNGIFLITERKRKTPEDMPLHLGLQVTSSIRLDDQEIHALSRTYFDHVNPKHPILFEEDFKHLIDLTDLQLEQLDVKGALIYLVFALGAAVQSSPDCIKCGDLPGNEYFRHAIPVLLREWPVSFQADLYLCQALFLASSWCSIMCWPMQAWRMIHMASTNIQHAFLAFPPRDRPASQGLVRLSWAISLVECDLLAEYHLPRSGIENVVERLYYPEYEPVSVDALTWLSNLSARRLMNRVHFTVYNNSSDGHAPYSINSVDQIVDRALLDSGSSNNLLATSTELYHQLHQWWGLIPPSVRPDLEDTEPDPNNGTLLLRFWACGDVIYRPFLYKLCAATPDMATDSLIDPALHCIRHCRRFLQTAQHLTKTPSPFTMISLHS
ncbi:hypothetical protein N7449_004356 [Penicillium cf. viridicatum]|uniref:Xylanolytic transcriptional activator regulatory domain-containing protein n=1 Tax=Penicillium cf. viridicatum TaxID=2972119 RepID=A0A9W9SXZ4_9EURO|nr:hypothetical protein N7449_004356 [Penicillium cf. viridicatum]